MILVARLPRWSFVGIALGVAASVAAADDPESAREGAHAPSGFTEEVVVIGTAIKGTPIDSPFAVTSMDRDRLEAGGSPTWSDFFKKLGASRGIVGERSSAFNSNKFNIVASSVGNVNLRGLGASRTLVLFNGRRQVYLPARLIGGRFVDVNAMPRIAVERVEVLKEGASALYGSDAVSGVVNFATRKHFEGLDLSAGHEAIDDAGNSTFGAIWGREFGGAHFVTSFEQERYRALPERARPYTLAAWRPGQRGGWSSFGNPGAYLVRDDARRVVDVVVDPECEGFGGVAEPGTCRYRYQSFFNLIEETRFNRSFSELNGTWGDAGRYHLEALWSSVRSPRVRSSPSYPFVTLLNTDVLEVGPDHPGRVALCDRSGAGLGRCAGAEPWYFRGRSIGNAGPAFEVPRESEVFRLAGSIGGLATFLDRTHDYDLGVSWSRTTGSMTDHGTYTERLFLAFRGFGGPDCGVGVLAEASSSAKMRLNPADLAGRAGAGELSVLQPVQQRPPQRWAVRRPLRGRGESLSRPHARERRRSRRLAPERARERERGRVAGARCGAERGAAARDAELRRRLPVPALRRGGCADGRKQFRGASLPGALRPELRGARPVRPLCLHHDLRPL